MQKHFFAKNIFANEAKKGREGGPSRNPLLLEHSRGKNSDWYRA